MDVELRPVTDEEFLAFGRVSESTFGIHVKDEDVERFRTILPVERTLAAFDGDDIVATAGAFDTEVTLPGGARIPVGAVTVVGVLPTHRRRGLLRALMARQLDDLAERGIPAAVLTASESSIYGRFGYGEASTNVDWSISTAHAAFGREPDVPGRLRMATPERIRQVAPGVYDAAIAGIPATMPRSAAWWDIFVADPEEWRDGLPTLFHAVHETPAGEVDGYVSWRIRHDAQGELHGNELRVIDLYGADSEVEAALFRFVLDVDLVATVKLEARPVDDHLRWRLADRRRLVAEKVWDGLYLRILDPAAVLGARTWATGDTLVLDVVDPFRPGTEGRWRVGSDGCDRTDDPADLTLDVADLGAIALGGVAPTTLARAGRIDERTPGAVATADALFRTGVAPWLTTGF